MTVCMHTLVGIKSTCDRVSLSDKHLVMYAPHTLHRHWVYLDVMG